MNALLVLVTKLSSLHFSPGSFSTRRLAHFQFAGWLIFNSPAGSFSTRRLAHFQLAGWRG
jgi:hypothetical protein